MKLLVNKNIKKEPITSDNVAKSLKKSNIKGLRISGGGISKILKSVPPVEEKEEVYIKNENVYKDSIEEQINKMKELEEKVRKNVEREYVIYKELSELSESTNATPKMANYTHTQLLNTNKMFQNVTNKINEANKELEELEQTYKQLDNALKGIDILEKIYSMITESVYVKIQKDGFVRLINNISKSSNKMIVLNEDLLNEDSIKVRFSNHIPSYYKCKKTDSGYKSHRGVDVLVMYDELVSEIEGKKKHNKRREEINKEIDRAKAFSSRKMDNLTDEELQEYYEICKRLLSIDELSNNGFVSSLEKYIIGLERRLL